MYKGRIVNISWERVFITLEGVLEPICSDEEMYDAYRNRKPKWFTKETKEPIAKKFEKSYEKVKKVAEEIIPNYDENEIYFFLRTDGYAQTYLLDATVEEDLSFSIRMNVSNFRNREQIPNGEFYISVLHKGVDFALNTSLEVARKAADHSRSFLFDKDKQCYTISIFSTSNELDPLFQLKSFLFSREKKRKKFNLKKFKTAKTYALKKALMQFYYNVVHMFTPRTKKRILFATETRGNLQGNLEAIYNRMVERDMVKDYKIYMSFRKAPGRHNSFTSWMKLITYVAASDIILIDDYAPFLEWLDLKKDTKLIQVWHAGVGFKSVGFCRFGANASPKLKTGHRKYTYAITGSTSLKHVYSEVFGIEEDCVIPTGLPRIDQLMNPQKNKEFIEGFYKTYPELENKKIILFAPTFRGTGQSTAHYPYQLIDFDKLYEMCGDEYVFMFKMHPFIKKAPPIPEEYAQRIVDFTSYPNVNELLQVVDVMITDYSSIIYEYALLKRPMIFFAYDKDMYSVIRGFHNDFDTFAPGKICTTFEEVISTIQNEDYEVEKVEKFVEENFDYLDANSSDRFIDWLILDKKDEA